MAQRARWTSRYEKGLVDVLTEYNLSHYRGQNGWCSEGWNRIVKEVSKLFPEAGFTKSQIQDKEAQLKKDYKVIKSIIKRSGISWNPTTYMINTTTEKWEEIIEEDSRLKKYEDKSFPLYEALDCLYEGNIAQGKHYFTSSQPPCVGNTSRDVGGKTKTPSSMGRKHPREERTRSTNPPTRMDASASQGWENNTIEDEGHNSFYEVERMDAIGRSFDHQLPLDLNHEDFVPEDGDAYQEVQRSGDNGNPKNGNGVAQEVRSKKQKGTTSIPRMEETMLAYVDLKRKQASINEQASKQYSITSCLEVLVAMDDVSDEIKVLADDVFKNAENRELFLGYGSRLRGLWLKKEVAKLGTQLPPSECSCGRGPILAPTKWTHNDPKI